jgi:hypothetical protein
VTVGLGAALKVRVINRDVRLPIAMIKAARIVADAITSAARVVALEGVWLI